MAGVSKVVLDDTVLIDLTSDTVNKNVLLQGYTAHAADGSIIQGEVLWTEGISNQGSGSGEFADIPESQSPSVYVKATAYSVKSGILNIVVGYHDKQSIKVSHL